MHESLIEAPDVNPRMEHVSHFSVACWFFDSIGNDLKFTDESFLLRFDEYG
jgi:hypothetical protein